jgi:hypothetical protein
VHGHYNHTCKISGTADSQNTQHFLFLHFESYAAFFTAVIGSLQSSLYARYLEFQPFCTVCIFCIYTVCTILAFAYELQEAFPAIHPAFPACIAPAPFLQEHPHLRQNPGGFCRISAAFLQPHPYSCISPCIFSVSSVIFEAFPCKNRRGPVEGSRRSVQLPSKICEIPLQKQGLHDHLVLAHAA